MRAFDNLPSFAGYSRIDDYRLASLSLSVTRSRAGEQLSWLGLIDLVSWNCKNVRIFAEFSLRIVFQQYLMIVFLEFLILSFPL